MPTVLGIDASYARTGLVWVAGDDRKTRRPWQPKLTAHAALTFPVGPKRLNKALGKIMANLRNNRADLAIIEDAAYGAPSRLTVIKLKELSACFKLALDALDIPWLEASPSLVRKWLVGKGNADKDMVARELERRWSITFDNDKGHDLSDAAALALWGLLEKCK